MGEKTKIDWADHTWSPWHGCSEVSEGCANCYARSIDRRFAKPNPPGGQTRDQTPPPGHWGRDAPRRFFGEAHWKKPLAWNRAAEKAGVRRRVFPSMGDPFEGRTDLDDTRKRFRALIEATPMLDWLLLTKRPGRLSLLWDDYPNSGIPANVWLGVTAENQARADERILWLLQMPAAVRFVSVEPQLGPVDLRRVAGADCSDWFWPEHEKRDGLAIDWVICGAESGPKARPFDEDWARSLRDQCTAAGVPFFFKQGREPGTKTRCVGTTFFAQPTGKLVKMPQLDGRVWDQVPTVMTKVGGS